MPTPSATMGSVETFKPIPIIAMSASVSASDSQQCFAAGMNAFLPKPLNADRLLEQMARLLRLEWTYGSAPPGAPPQAGFMVAPPADELEVLHRLAMLGNMREIIEEADRLVQSDERYRPFANQLNALAGGYQSKAVLHLVEAYWHSGEALHDSR